MAKAGRIKGAKKGFGGYLLPPDFTIKPAKLGRPRKGEK